MDTREVFITTTDNPYNYFDEFDKWFSYDESQGYHTCSYIDNMTMSMFTESTDKEIHEELERAIDAIIRIDGSSLYKKIVRIGDEDINETDPRFANPIDFSI